MQRVRFPGVVDEMLPAQELVAPCEKHARRARTRPELSAAQVAWGLIFRQLHDKGALAGHGGRLHGVRMRDSAHAELRQLLPEKPSGQIMRAEVGCHRRLADASGTTVWKTFGTRRFCPSVAHDPVPASGANPSASGLAMTSGDPSPERPGSSWRPSDVIMTANDHKLPYRHWE